MFAESEKFVESEVVVIEAPVYWFLSKYLPNFKQKNAGLLFNKNSNQIYQIIAYLVIFSKSFRIGIYFVSNSNREPFCNQELKDLKIKTHPSAFCWHNIIKQGEPTFNYAFYTFHLSKVLFVLYEIIKGLLCKWSAAYFYPRATMNPSSLSKNTHNFKRFF